MRAFPATTAIICTAFSKSAFAQTTAEQTRSVPIINDWLELVIGVLTLGAIIIALRQVAEERSNRKADVEALKTETTALVGLASEGARQTTLMIAQNQSLEYQNSKLTEQVKLSQDLLSTYLEDVQKSKEYQRKERLLKARERRNDIRPHFFPVMQYPRPAGGWGIDLINRGKTAHSLQILRHSENISIREFDSVRIETEQTVKIFGNFVIPQSPTSATNGAMSVPLEFVLGYADGDGNEYSQGVDFPNGLGRAPFFSQPNLLTPEEGADTDVNG